MSKKKLRDEDLAEIENKRNQKIFDDYNNPQDPNTLETTLKKNKIKGFNPSKSMLDEEFEDQKELQEDDLSAQQEFDQANKGFNRLYEVGKTADNILGSGGALGELFDWIKGKTEGKDLPFPTQLLLKEQKDLPLDKTKALIPARSQTNMVRNFYGGNITSEGIEYLKALVYGRPKKAKPGPGQMGLDLSYVQLSETIKQPLTDSDLTQEEMIRYGRQNAENASVNIEDYLSQFGASTSLRKAIRTNMLKPFQKKYGASDEQVKRFAKLANRNTKDIAKTIKYLNFEYKLFQPGLSELKPANLEDIANEMSIVYGQDIDAKTIDAIIKGQGGEISYQTDGMKGRGEDPLIIKTREDLLNVYKSRIELLNTHGAFDKGHVYAADQLLKDNKVSNASMYKNLEPEIRASIRQLVSKPELDQLINGQLTKGTDYIEAIIGNRSKKAGGDPGDKIFERLYGNAYGLEEDFRNYLFPKQNLANMIHEDLKPIFGQKYTRIVKEKVKERKGISAGPQLQVGSQTLNIIRLEAMKEVLEDYVAGTEITEEEEKAQESLAKVQVFLDFVTNKEMTYKGEARKGNE